MGPAPGPGEATPLVGTDAIGESNTESDAATEDSGARRTRRGMVGITMSLSLNCGSGIW